MTAPVATFADLPRVLDGAVTVAEFAINERVGLLITAPPGVGATMIARRMPAAVSELNPLAREFLTATYQATGMFPPSMDYTDGPPFRCPHHSISASALTGATGRAGEVQLAAYGVLFLDELPEFQGRAIDELGQVLRAMGHRAPQLVASASPCPCGYHGTIGNHARTCSCRPDSYESYRKRVRGMAKELGLTRNITVPGLSIADLRE